MSKIFRRRKRVFFAILWAILFALGVVHSGQLFGYGVQEDAQSREYNRDIAIGGIDQAGELNLNKC